MSAKCRRRGRGFSPSQQIRYRRLLNEAFDAHCERTGLNPNADGLFETWKVEQLREVTGHPSSVYLNQVEDYDCVCLHLATIAGNDSEIAKFSQAAETRMRHVLGKAMDALSILEGRPVGWSYVQAILQHMHLPELDECPAGLLWKTFQALDEHVRRTLARRAEPVPSGFVWSEWTRQTQQRWRARHAA